MTILPIFYCGDVTRLGQNAAPPKYISPYKLHLPSEHQTMTSWGVDSQGIVQVLQRSSELTKQ